MEEGLVVLRQRLGGDVGEGVSQLRVRIVQKLALLGNVLLRGGELRAERSGGAVGGGELLPHEFRLRRFPLEARRKIRAPLFGGGERRLHRFTAPPRLALANQKPDDEPAGDSDE